MWGLHDGDGNVRYLQSRVQWLPNHTADVQTQHIQKDLEKCNAILNSVDIPLTKKLSVLHIVEFMSITNYTKTWRLNICMNLNLSQNRKACQRLIGKHVNTYISQLVNSIPVQKSVDLSLKECNQLSHTTWVTVLVSGD